MKTNYKRKLSAIERYNLVINAVTRYNVEGVIEGIGELQQAPWQKAVDIAAEANPGVRVRLKSFLGFCKWVDSGISPEVKVIEAPDWDSYSEKGTEHFERKFDALKNDPVCDILLIPGTPAKIIIRCLHAAMDARGMVHFIHDIFRALRGEAVVGSYSTMTDLDVRLQNQDNVKVEKAEPVTSIAPMPLPKKPLPADQESQLKYMWRRVKLSKKVNNMLPKMALFLASQARKHESGEVQFTIPVDLRELRAKVDTIGNLTGYIKVKVLAEDKPRDVMKRINQQIRDYGDCYNPSYLAIIPWVPIKLLIDKLKKDVNGILYDHSDGVPTGGIVSIGTYKAEQYSYPGFEAKTMFGIPGSVGKLNVIIQDHGGVSQLVFCTPVAYNNEGQFEQLIEECKQAFDETSPETSPEASSKGKPEAKMDSSISPSSNGEHEQQEKVLEPA